MVEPVGGPFRLPIAGELMTSKRAMQAFAACTIADFRAPPSCTFLQGIGPSLARAGQIFDLHVLQHSQPRAAVADDLQASRGKGPTARRGSWRSTAQATWQRYAVSAHGCAQPLAPGRPSQNVAMPLNPARTICLTRPVAHAPSGRPRAATHVPSFYPRLTARNLAGAAARLTYPRT